MSFKGTHMDNELCYNCDIVSELISRFVSENAGIGQVNILLNAFNCCMSYDGIRISFDFTAEAKKNKLLMKFGATDLGLFIIKSFIKSWLGVNIELYETSRDSKDDMSLLTTDLSDKTSETRGNKEKYRLWDYIRNLKKIIRNILLVRTKKTIYISENEINNIIRFIQEGNSNGKKCGNSFFNKILILVIAYFNKSSKENCNSRTCLGEYCITFNDGRVFVVENNGSFKLEITDLNIKYNNKRFSAFLNTDKGNINCENLLLFYEQGNICYNIIASGKIHNDIVMSLLSDYKE